MNYALPVPPSKNDLYYGAKRMKRVYRDWRSVAGWEVNVQGRLLVPSPVRLVYSCPENMRRDLGNHETATTDLLVEMGIIEDDRCRHVREIVQRWRPTDESELMHVTVEAAGAR